MTDARPVVQVEGLRKAFAGRPIFDDVTLSVGAGDAVAIMGASGTGKTTLLRCMIGFDRADAGKIRAGHAVLEHTAAAAPFRAATLAVRRQVGMVFQGWHLFSHRSVLGNVMEGMTVVRGLSAAEARPRALALLDEVAVAHRADAFPHRLSGGEQQRVAIARALAMEPAALLLDEPTSALDEARTLALVALLARLRAGGLALIAVTHDPDFARALAAKVLHLEGGRLRARDGDLAPGALKGAGDDQP